MIYEWPKAKQLVSKLSFTFYVNNNSSNYFIFSERLNLTAQKQLFTGAIPGIF